MTNSQPTNDKHFLSNLIGNPQAIILANGIYPTNPLCLHYLTHTPIVICCDGAANTYLSKGHIPTAIVGDGDSLSHPLKEKYKNIIYQESEQETNDLSKAFRLSQKWKKNKLLILGATGKREDHSLGNISLLIDYHLAGAEVAMLTDYGLFLPFTDCFSANLPIHTRISIFNFGATEIKSQGLAYPLYDFNKLWQGTLNHTNTSHVSLSCKGTCLLYFSIEK